MHYRPAAALAEGCQATFLACAVLAGIGTALGVAIVTTVAVSRSQHYLAAHKGANPLAALTEGYQSAFLACAGGRDRPGAGVPAPQADRGSQRTSCQSRTRRPMPLPQETW